MSRSASIDGGTSEPPAQPPPRRRPRRDPQDPPPTLAIRNEHERIQVAAAKAIATHGYETCTVEDICAEAGVSEETFHAHFRDKQEVALTAVEMGVDQVMVDCQEAFKAAPSWPEAVWDACAVYLDWMASEADFTRLAVVELLAAGTPALELLQSLMDAFAMFLDPGYELAAADAPPQRLIEETVANAVFGLLHDHVLSEPPETAPRLLPELVRRILTPFLGAAAAAAFVHEHATRE